MRALQEELGCSLVAVSWLGLYFLYRLNRTEHPTGQHAMVPPQMAAKFSVPSAHTATQDLCSSALIPDSCTALSSVCALGCSLVLLTQPSMLLLSLEARAWKKCVQTLGATGKLSSHSGVPEDPHPGPKQPPPLDTVLAPWHCFATSHPWGDPRPSRLSCLTCSRWNAVGTV